MTALSNAIHGHRQLLGVFSGDALPGVQPTLAYACFGDYSPLVFSSAYEGHAQLGSYWVIDLATFWPLTIF